MATLLNSKEMHHFVCHSLVAVNHCNVKNAQSKEKGLGIIRGPLLLFSSASEFYFLSFLVCFAHSIISFSKIDSGTEPRLNNLS